eukprot:6208792-Pleurochrysis_carterae.AAC.1
MFKFLILRHADAWCRERLAAFFAGMKRPIDLRKKSDGRQRAEKWWRASTWDDMVRGSATLPGGIAAWLPSVCFIIMDAHLEARRVHGGRLSDEVRKLLPDEGPSKKGGGEGARGGFDIEPDSDEEPLGVEAALRDASGGDEFFTHLTRDLGMALASALLNVVRGFDRYMRWHEAIRAEPETDDQTGREALALRCGVTAVECMDMLEDASNSTHKSWMPHIIIYIIPFF